MPTTPEDAASLARGNAEKLSNGFQKLLAQIGIEGWRLASFRIEPGEVGFKAVARCGPGEVYDCRWINGSVVCGCFPK
jgi:hypothetical protein